MKKEEPEKQTHLSDIRFSYENVQQGKGQDKYRISLSTDVRSSLDGGLDKEYEKLLELQIPNSQGQENMYPQLQQNDGGDNYGWSNQPNSYDSYSTQWQIPTQTQENFQYYPQIQNNFAYQPYQPHNYYPNYHTYHQNYHCYQNQQGHYSYYYPQNTFNMAESSMQMPQPKSQVIKLGNKEKQFQKCRFRGRGRGRWSSGWRGSRGSRQQKRHHSSSSSSSNSSKEGKKKSYHGRHSYHNKFEQKIQVEKSQSSQSQSEKQIEKIEKQFEKLNIQMNQQAKINNFTSCLEPFFDKYNSSPLTKQKILKYLSKNFDSLEKLDPFISALYGLQFTFPEYFTYENPSLLAIVKQIVKQKYDLEAIKQKLDKKIHIKLKKEYHDEKFRQNFPDAVDIDFLEVDDLLKLNKQKTLFLVDGNNIMPKQKKFRLYFESKEERKRAEGQIRLIWLFAEALKAEIFFDNQYNSQLYKEIQLDIQSKEEEEAVNKVPVHFAAKNQNPNNTADMKIVERLTSIAESGKFKDYQIVLVSADNELAQICHAIFPIKKTSGRFIFKYCKKMIKQKYFNRPQKKGIIKRIFTY